MKNPSQDQLDTLVLAHGKRVRGTQSVETASVSNKDLLQLEKTTSVLEKRLLVCTNGEDLTNSRSLRKREPPTTCSMPESSDFDIPLPKRIKSFLPTFDQANCKLLADIQARGADEFDIEVVSETGGALYRNGAELAANGQVLKAVKSEEPSECDTDDDISDNYEDSNRMDSNGLLEVTRFRGSSQTSGSDLQKCHNDKLEIKQKKIEVL